MRTRRSAVVPRAKSRSGCWPRAPTTSSPARSAALRASSEKSVATTIGFTMPEHTEIGYFRLS